jgi:hypothetical protein
LLASLKTLTNSKNCLVSRIKFLLGLSFALIGRFFPVYVHSRLSEQFSGSQAGYGSTFINTGCYQKARTSSLKKVTGRNFTKILNWLSLTRTSISEFLPGTRICIGLSLALNCCKINEEGKLGSFGRCVWQNVYLL